MLHEVTAFQVDMHTAFQREIIYAHKFDRGIEARLMTQQMSLSILQTGFALLLPLMLELIGKPQGHLTCGFEYLN